jgi:hypothetical protein
MNERPESTISELLADHSLISEAIARGVREAILKHAQAGNPVCTLENGKVVWISADAVLSRLYDGPAS